MEYNKRTFTKANDKKVLHKVKKQWVVISLSLLAALGLKALATNNASADTTTAAGDTNAKQVNSSQSKLNATLVQHNNQNNNGSNNTGRSTQGRQNMQSSVSSSGIMKGASDMHQDILRNAMSQSSNANSGQNNSNHSAQSSSKIHHQLLGSAPTSPSNNNSSDNTKETRSDGMIQFQLNNQHGKTIATPSFYGKPGNYYNVNQIWDALKGYVKGYHLNSDDYNTNRNVNTRFLMPAKGKTVPPQTLYLQGDKIQSPYITIAINTKVSDGANGTQQHIIHYTTKGSVGDITINPYTFLNNSDGNNYASAFSDGQKLTQSDFHQVLPVDHPYSINVDSDGNANPSSISYLYVKNDLNSDDSNVKLPIIYTRYYDRAGYKSDETPSDNNQTLHSIKSDKYIAGKPFDHQDRQNDIPYGYFFVKNIGGNGAIPQTFGANKKFINYYNVQIAKDAQVIYQIPSENYRQVHQQILDNFKPTGDKLNGANFVSEKALDSNIPDGYTTNPNGGDNLPYSDVNAYLNQKDQENPGQSPLSHFTITDGGKYYIDLYPKNEQFKVDYVNYNWPSDVVAHANNGKPYTGKYNQNVTLNNTSNVAEIPKNGDNKSWQMPSDQDPTDNNKPYNKEYNTMTYTFGNSSYYTVPVTIPGDETTKIVYLDTTDNNQPVGQPKFITGNPSDEMAPHYKNAKENIPYGYTSDTPLNNSTKLPKYIGFTKPGHAEPIYVKRDYSVGIVNYKDLSDGQYLFEDKALEEPVHQKVNSQVNEAPYLKYIPIDYHQDSQEPVSPTINDWVMRNNSKNTFTINLRRNRGTVIINYYVNGKHVDCNMNGKPQSDFESTDYVIDELGDKTKYYQDPAINDHMPDVQYNSKKITTSNPNNAPIKDYGDTQNNVQHINVYLTTPSIKGYIRYWDPSDTSQGAGGSYYPDTGNPITISGHQSDPVNYQNYPQPSVMSKYVPDPNGNYSYQIVSYNKNAKLEPNNDYDIKIRRMGKINVRYVTSDNTNNVVKSDPTVSDHVGSDFNWNTYTNEIPSGYYWIKNLNSVDTFTTKPQTLYIDIAKNQKPTPQTPTSDNGNAVITYMDVNGTRIRGISKTGHKGEGIPNSMYTDNLPSGYVIDHYDPNNQNLYNGANNIIWVKRPSTPTPTSYAPAPSSASSMPSASASSASPAPSQSSVAPSSSVTPPSSKSVAPQRKSTIPVHHARRGNIGVTYEEPNGKVITKRNYRGKVGESFTPNTTPKPGYRYEIVSGSGVDQFQKRGQHVVMRLVKIASMNRRNDHVDTRNSRPVTTIPSSKRTKGSAFDQALNKEATLARRRQSGKLPQTGESQSNYVEVIGAALLMISAVFVAGYDFDMKRRRD